MTRVLDVLYKTLISFRTQRSYQIPAICSVKNKTIFYNIFTINLNQDLAHIFK